MGLVKQYCHQSYSQRTVMISAMDTRQKTSLNSKIDKSTKKEEVGEGEEDSKWTWYPCDFVLREVIDGEKVFRSLKPCVELVSPKQSEQHMDMELKVVMDRDFQYCQESGWGWHKSWIIPNIKVSLSTSVGRKFNYILPENSFFQIKVVKTSSKNPSRLFLLDVGIHGIDSISAQSGSVVFQGLKFQQTSYKNQGSKFNLVVVLKYSEPGNIHPKIVQSLISPPIFVDSRRTLKRAISTRQDPKSEYDAFNPSRLVEVFVKRVRNGQQIITDSTVGLLGYLTAPNIRNKIKNPFFLAVKFSHAIRLFYNRLLVPLSQDLVKTSMKRLKNSTMEDDFKSKKDRKLCEIMGKDTILCILIKGDEVLAREVTSRLTSNAVIQFCPQSTILPQCFVELDVLTIKSQYEEHFNYCNGSQTSQVLVIEEKGERQQLLVRPIPAIQIHSSDMSLRDKQILHKNSNPSLREAGYRLVRQEFRVTAFKPIQILCGLSNCPQIILRNGQFRQQIQGLNTIPVPVQRRMID